MKTQSPTEKRAKRTYTAAAGMGLRQLRWWWRWQFIVTFDFGRPLISYHLGVLTLFSYSIFVGRFLINNIFCVEWVIKYFKKYYCYRKDVFLDMGAENIEI